MSGHWRRREQRLNWRCLGVKSDLSSTPLGLSANTLTAAPTPGSLPQRRLLQIGLYLKEPKIDTLETQH
jgi:hypothetical protein